jgi:hypothetical protein
MAYLLTEPLNDAWYALSLREAKIDYPQALAAPFLSVLEAWNIRHDASLYSSQGSQPLTVRELEQWTAVLQEWQSKIAQLEAKYPQRKTNGGGGKIIKVEDQSVTGALPWWYWPLRIGAGVGAGWLTYRILRPEQRGASAFAGLGYATNREGMTWEQWRESAHRMHLNDRERRALQAAWRRGDDPEQYWLDDEPGPRSGQRRD